MQLKILSETFYTRYAHCNEILKKENRPYACLTIELDGQLFAVPFRHHIKHQYAFHTIGEAELDFTKSVIITDAHFFSDDKPSIESKEFAIIKREENKIRYGLRRSEICALTLNDFNGDIVRVNKAKVLNEDTQWINKTTKTVSSTRDVIIPMELADKIREKGYIYKGHPNVITKFLEHTEDKLGIPRFPLHKLRHYFASKMSALNVPEADIMRMGGWETDYVMKGVYRHSMMDKEERAKREASDKLRNAIFS